MYVVREIFHLQFGRYKEAKALLKEAAHNNVFSQPAGSRIMTDFTGEGYRLILEHPFKSLADYETDLQKDMGGNGWGNWYEKFKPLIRQSEREILKVIESN